MVIPFCMCGFCKLRLLPVDTAVLVRVNIGTLTGTMTPQKQAPVQLALNVLSRHKPNIVEPWMSGRFDSYLWSKRM